MADATHIDILYEGVEAWNEWRRQNPGKKPNLVGEDLSEMDLTGVNLGGADLTGSNLSHADITRSNLRNANLAACNLTHMKDGGFREKRGLRDSGPRFVFR